MNAPINEKLSLNQWLGVLGVSLLAFTCFLDITIVSNALPAIRKSLNATDVQLQWLVNSIYVALCAFMATLGRIGDVYGLRKIFYISMGGMALSSLASGLSSTIEQLIFFRALQGICLASITLTGGLIAHNVPLSQQSKGMALFSGFAGLGLALGPIIGGLLVDYFDWRWIFFINVPIIAIGILFCIFNLNEPELKKNETIDWLGAFFFVIAISCLIITLMQGEEWGWDRPISVTLLVISAISLFIFLLIEKRVTTPLLPFSALANRTFVPAALTCATCGAFIATLLFFDPLYFQSILGLSATRSGWLLMSTSIAYISISPFAGWITHHISAKVGTAAVTALLTLAACTHVFFTVELHTPIILMGLILFGMAWGIVNVSPVVAVLQHVGNKNSGVIIGALWTFFNLGSAVVLAILGIIFRKLEFSSLLRNLGGHQNELIKQKHLLYQIIHQPEQAKQLIQQLPFNLINDVTKAYKLAFVESFQAIAIILMVLACIVFFIVATFMKIRAS